MRGHTMRAIAIDPGTTRSGYIIYGDATQPRDMQFGKVLNSDLAVMLTKWSGGRDLTNSVLIVEMISSYGKPVGKSIFETCAWVGEFVRAWGRTYRLLERREVKHHLCGSTRTTDADVRRELIRRFGLPGTKGSPGPTRGITGDVWAALGVAVTYVDQLCAWERGDRGGAPGRLLLADQEAPPSNPGPEGGAGDDAGRRRSAS